MQVPGVGQAGSAGLLELAPIHREQRFEHRIDHHRQREPWRHLRVPVNQQDAHQPGAHPPEIGAAIAREDASAREIPAQEAQGASGQRHADRQQLAIANLPAHHAQRGEHHHADHAGQPVVAIDDIDRVRDAAHRHHREHQRERIPLQEVVDARDIGTGHHRIEEIDRNQRGQETRPQPHVGAELLGDVFQQPRREGGQGADAEDDGEPAADRPQPYGQGQARDESGRHRHAAYPHRRDRVEFLRSAGGMIVRQVRMQMLEAQQQPACGERDRQR